MKMHVHELHPALVHAPLTLLPAATVVDWVALGGGDRAWARVGRALWVAGTAGAALAGVSGLAASQEVKAQDVEAQSAMFVHGLGNTVILLGALGLTAWRLGHRPSATVCTLGTLACGAAVFTAYLGGELVYAHGAGIRAMPAHAAQGARPGTPPLFSRQAPATLLRDALAGLRWLLGHAGGVLSERGRAGAQRARGLLQRRKEAGAGAPYTPAHGVSHLPEPRA